MSDQGPKVEDLKDETPAERAASEARYKAWLRNQAKHSELETPNAADIDEGDEEEEDE